MLRRRFGRTELQIPVFSCGGMRYQQRWDSGTLEGVTDENQKNLEDTIRRSVEVGINHIETARGYGSSEAQLGLVLPSFPREELIVQTKIGPEKDPAVFRKNFEESLERLNLDHVELLAIHGVNDEETLEMSIRPGGCLEVCRQLQREGLARSIGFSTHGPTDVIQKAINHKGDGGFDYVNLHWYYINQMNWPAIEDATRLDMGVFIISPSDKGGMLYKPTKVMEELTAPLHPIVFNDLFCLHRSEIHTLSLGAARPSDFDLHLEAVKLYEKRGELLPPILERLADRYKEVLGTDFANRWEEGLPKWQDVPEGINIHSALWLLNLAKAYDMVEYGQMRYNLLGTAGNWFPGFTAAKLDEVDLAPVLKDSPFADRIPGLLAEAHQMLVTAPKKRLSES
jgi:uncharacterized protein